MAKRFIKLYEQITSWEWYRYPNTLCLFIYLLLKANYKDLTFHGRVIKRGQLLTSIPRISTDTGLTVQQTKTALMHLRSTGEVTDEASNQYRVITVVKYDAYQSSTDKSTDDQPATNRQVNRQLTDELTPCIEYIEKDRYIEQIDNNTPSRGGGFDEFWNIYPKKVSKQDAMKAWKALKPNADLQAAIMSSLQQWITSDQWQRENGQYIPYPATWLRKRRWEDEPEQGKPPAPVQPNKVIAQQYDQRDYKDVQEQHMASQQEYILQRLREMGEI